MKHFAGMGAPVTVIGVGCEIDRLFSGQPPALPVPGPPGQDDLRDLFDAIAAQGVRELNPNTNVRRAAQSALKVADELARAADSLTDGRRRQVPLASETT